MVTVYVSDHESIETALKRFSKKVQDARIILEVKERQAYMKPSDRRRKERAAGKARCLKKQRKTEKMLEFLANNKVPSRRPRPSFNNNHNNGAPSNGNNSASNSPHPNASPNYNRDRKPHFKNNDFRNDRQKRTVYVGGLSYRTVEESLLNHFSSAVKVESVKIILDRETQKSRGFGFVELSVESDVQAAIDAFNETEFEGRRIMVSANKTKAEKDKEKTTSSKPPNSPLVSEEDLQELQAKFSGKTA